VSEVCGPPAEQEVLLFGLRRLLLVLHAACSIVLVGASTHHALAMRHYLAGRFARRAHERRWAEVTAVTYVLTYALGALLYPSYRVFVRGFYLDHHAPLYAGLFDVKEIFASLVLVVALALGALARALDPPREPHLARVYAVMSMLVCAVVWLNVVLGLLVTSVRGLG
jgi:hypothetical protein